MLIGMPGFFIFLLITSMLRGVGDTVTPLLTLIFSIGIGLVVTPALIQGWFGLPQIGVLSAAVAFIAGFVVVLVFLYFYLSAGKGPMAPDAELIAQPQDRHQAARPRAEARACRPVSPWWSSSLSGIVIIGIVNSFGSDATAAYGSVNQVLSYVQFPAMSIGIASAIFAAQAIGARRFDEVEHVTRTAAIINLLFTGALVLLAYLFSQHLVALFITDPAVVRARRAAAAHRAVELPVLRLGLDLFGGDAGVGRCVDPDDAVAGGDHLRRSAVGADRSAASSGSKGCGWATASASPPCSCSRRSTISAGGGRRRSWRWCRASGSWNGQTKGGRSNARGGGGGDAL